MWVLSLSPIAHPRWFFVRSLPIKMPLHPCEQPNGAYTARNSVVLQYFPVRTLALRQSGLSMIRQLSLARRASLKHWMSLKPSPPSFLDLVSVMYVTHDIFRWSGLSSHQNRVRADCILLQKDSGSIKHDIEWLSIADSTDFRSVIFPAVERKRMDHRIAFCLVLSTIPMNKSFFFLPKFSSSPKYLPAPPSFWIFRAPLTLSFISWGAFLEKVVPDYRWFICWPEPFSYRIRMSWRAVTLLVLVLQKKRVSSENKRWFTLGLLGC